MKNLKKVTAASILSLFASQMEASAIFIIEGNEDVERGLVKAKPSGQGSFRKKSRYKNVDVLRVNFGQNEITSSQENPIIVKFSNEDIKNIIAKVNQYKMGKFVKHRITAFKINRKNADLQQGNDAFDRKPSKLNYRYLFNLAEETYPISTRLIFDLGVLSQDNRWLLGSFFKELSEKGRLKDEVRYMDEKGNRVRITPNNIERLDETSKLNSQSTDKDSIVQTIWRKCFTDNITIPKYSEHYVLYNAEESEIILGSYQYRHKLRVYFDGISTPDDTAIVRAFFDKLKKVKHFSGEIHLNVMNGGHYVIAEDRIASSLPSGFGLEISGLNYKDYIEGYLNLLPKIREEVEELSNSPSHLSDDEISQPLSRRLSDSQELSDNV
jgi:hypothetical protein